MLACQLAKEGSFPPQKVDLVMKGEFVDGEIIPTIGIRHFSPEFAKLNGLRIVRIASHPDLVNKGLGKIAIKKLID